jgi:endonuclease G
MKNKGIIGGIIALIIIVLAILICFWAGKFINDKLAEINEPVAEKPVDKPDSKDSSQETYGSVHLTFGNPGNAMTNPENTDNFLLLNDYYALSYSRNKSAANWAAWRLTKKDLGGADRQNDFRPDDRLPEGWKSIFPSYYTRSGFDRGHIVPSADRTNSVKANSSTFLMTNMLPQEPDLNQGPWEKLESYSRSLARRKNDLYIYAGGYGEKGKLRKTISIPTDLWKIIIVIPENAPMSAINANTRIIAVDMPNISGIKSENWRKYKTTVRNLEQKTGYDFLSNLPPALQKVLEVRVDMR